MSFLKSVFFLNFGIPKFFWIERFQEILNPTDCYYDSILVDNKNRIILLIVNSKRNALLSGNSAIKPYISPLF